MSLNEINVDTYVYEGHNNHSTKYISDGNITFEQLKESSTITIPEKLFIVTLSEQNISTRSALSDIITILAFDKSFEKDTYDIFEYDQSTNKYKVNILKVFYLKINILLNIVNNLYKLNIRKISSGQSQSSSKIINLYNSPYIIESFIQFDKTDHINEKRFEEILELAKRKLLDNKIFSQPILDESYYNLDTMYKEYGKHFIYLFTIVLKLNNDSVDLFVYFIIDKYIKQKYSNNGIHDIYYEAHKGIINHEISILIYLSDLFMSAGRLDIRFYAPGDKCRNISFSKKPLNFFKKEFIYFEKECVEIYSSNDKYIEIIEFYKKNKYYYKNEIVYYQDKSNDIYRVKDDNNIHIIKYYSNNSPIYNTYRDYIFDYDTPVDPSMYQDEDGDYYEDFGQLYYISYEKSYIYGILKFSNYINMKNEDEPFTIPNRKGINLIPNNSESKFSKDNNLLFSVNDIIKFEDMTSRILSIPKTKENKLLIITGCGNYTSQLDDYLNYINDRSPYNVVTEFRKYINKLGQIIISYEFEAALRIMNRINIEIYDEEIKRTKINVDNNYDVHIKGSDKRINDLKKQKYYNEYNFYKYKNKYYNKNYFELYIKYKNKYIKLKNT
jgi:hypothetical protein|uniref:Uncharacterized protein n=1 Tax=viral metagenome TaxID=1070528 RepID=A0A6C0IV25_9ZZZZ